jgi:hypothetical protein
MNDGKYNLNVMKWNRCSTPKIWDSAAFCVAREKNIGKRILTPYISGNWQDQISYRPLALGARLASDGWSTTNLHDIENLH